MNRLRALKAILTTGSFTAAGQLLGYSQSAISQMINSLESDVGFPLLYRTHGQVSLTPDGQKLLPLVEQLCNDWTTFRTAQLKSRAFSLQQSKSVLFLVFLHTGCRH